MKIFYTIGSIPICLLNADFPSKAISFTKSLSKSGILLAISPLLTKFLSIVISNVGRELLLVIS
jgi:hypothetical protein